MKFKTLGNPNNPAALFIHAMFFSETMFHDICQLMQDSYYIVLPTLDAHVKDEKTAFCSVQEEADKIAEYLIENEIHTIEILLGTSLGGIIAFELFEQKKVLISNVYLDGAPFICFSKFRIKLMAGMFKRIAHKSFKSPNKKNLLNILFPAHAAEMKNICGKMEDESINNLAQACYSYKLPSGVSLEPFQTLTFLYGTKELAKMCIPVVKKFSNCKLIIKEGYGHCEFLDKEPRKYVEMLCNTKE